MAALKTSPQMADLHLLTSGLARRHALLLGLLAASGARAESLPLLSMGIYMPVMRDTARKDVEVSFRYWLQELGRANNINAAPVQFYDDLAALKQDVDAGKVTFMVATTMGIAQHFPDAQLADGVSGYKGLHDDLLLVVRRDGGIHTIADLAAKRVALLEADELTQIYLDVLLMKTWGTPDRRRLGTLSYETRSVKLTHRLFFSQTDAALIYRSGYDAAAAMNPQIGQTLQILEPYAFKTRGPSIGLFSARSAPELRELFIKSALGLNRTERGRQLLQLYQSDQLERSLKAEVQPYRDLLASYQSLQAATASAPKKKRVK